MSNALESDIKELNKLGGICASGSKFYRESMEQIDNQPIVQVFSEMASVRDGLLTKINFLIRELGGEPDYDASNLKESLHQAYSTIKAKLSSDTVHTYISELEELEDRTLEEFRDAHEEAETAKVKQLISSCLMTLQQTHDKMKHLQKATA